MRATSPPTAGTIELDGEPVEIGSPAHAHELGIGIVYQELSLLPNLSVAHNISLGGEPMRGLSIDEDAVRATARRMRSGRIGVDRASAPDRARRRRCRSPSGSSSRSRRS